MKFDQVVIYFPMWMVRFYVTAIIIIVAAIILFVLFTLLIELSEVCINSIRSLLETI